MNSFSGFLSPSFLFNLFGILLMVIVTLVITMTTKKYELRGAEGGEDESLLVQLNKNISRLMEEVSSMKTEFKSLKTESKNTKKELNRKFDDFQEELTNRFDEIKTAIDTNTKDIKENRTQILEVSKEVAEIEGRTKNSEEKIEILETQIRNKNLLLRGISENFGRTNLREEFEEEIQKILETIFNRH